MRILCGLLVLFLFTECSSPKEMSQEEPARSLSIEVYLEAFQQAVLNHNGPELMRLMDQNYVKEQHDDFLEGRTEQFLNEFFCGTLTNQKGFKCLDFKKINKLQQLRVEAVDLGGFKVFYIVSDGQYEINADWFVKEYLHQSESNFGLIGGVG